jgi:hypothetical protein
MIASLAVKTSKVSACRVRSIAPTYVVSIYSTDINEVGLRRRLVVRSGGAVRRLVATPRPIPFLAAEWIVARATPSPRRDTFASGDSNRAPVAPEAGQPNPHPAIRWGQLRAFSRGALQHADLVAPSQVLYLKHRARTEHERQSAKQRRKNNEHRRRIRIESIIPIRSDTSRFSRGTVDLANRDSRKNHCITKRRRCFSSRSSSSGILSDPFLQSRIA